MSLFSDPSFLKRCDELKALLGADRFSPGIKVARGYADLGYEEFLILPNNKLLSLYSAKISEIPPGHSQHFFWVPSAVELLEEIQRHGDILGIDFELQRLWKIRLMPLGSDKELVTSGASLDETLLEAFSYLGALK